ncbi:helix-turn-helix domain-containing protein [Streptomyces sp. NPDC091280]|uniref:helix-turn-helix domain-containing protein n=1 Tax=Streptomyces sp. NPDC091280 TaxID=3365984 RepID=UPI0038097795
MTHSVPAVPAVIGWTPWQVRAGWLLRSHRLCHADPVLRRLAGFARAYREDRRYARGVSPSSLSRWENGLVPVPASAVRRYEDVLGLSACHLLAPIQTIARHEGGMTAAAFLRADRGDSPSASSGPRMEHLLARTLDGGVLTGTDWDDLTRWAAYEGGQVYPGRVRHAVVQRLLEETVVAGGTAWMLRFEALNRLMADPLWGPEAIAVCAEVAQQPDHVGLIETVCALDGSPHPDAGRAVLRQLTDPTTGDTRYGALLAAARKTRKGHFTAEQTRTLVDVVHGVLAGPRLSQPSSFAEAAAVLLHRLPLSAAHRAQLTTSASDRGSAVNSIVTHGSLTDPATAAITVSRVLGRLDDPGPGPAATVLGTLIDDLLHHPVADVRLYAAMMLRASPYGPRIASALAADVCQVAVLGTGDRAIPILHALRVLGGPDQRAVVADLTLARGVPRAIALAAVHALGHIGGRSPESYWRAVFHQHVRAAHGTADQREVLKRLVYAFAMGGELELLTRLVAEPEPRGRPARDLSGWWTNLDHHVRDSAQR